MHDPAPRAVHDDLLSRRDDYPILGRTTYLITHRLHTLEIADRILVLENGRVAALGTHAELMAGCPAYQRLQEAQGQRLCA